MKDYNSELIILFQRYFRVEHFGWCSHGIFRLEVMHPANIPFDTSQFKTVVQNWRNIESVIDYSDLGLSTHLLDTTTCNQLTSIDISFFDIAYMSDMPRNKTRAFIASIHNAPSLTSITLSHTTIKREDLEALHKSTPNLKFVKLDEIRIYCTDTRALIGIQPAENIQSFSMQICALDLEDVSARTVESTPQNWIYYIGNKYTQLQDLELCSNKPSLTTDSNRELTSASLAKALGNLKQLKTYTVNLVAPSQQALDILDANEVQLSHLMMSVDKEMDPIEETLDLITSAPPTSTVFFLLVQKDRTLNDLAISRGVITLGRRLNHLTHLTIYAKSIDVFKVDLYVDILQNLDLLESLEIRSIELLHRSTYSS